MAEERITLNNEEKKWLIVIVTFTLLTMWIGLKLTITLALAIIGTYLLYNHKKKNKKQKIVDQVKYEVRK